MNRATPLQTSGSAVENGTITGEEDNKESEVMCEGNDVIWSLTGRKSHVPVEGPSVFAPSSWWNQQMCVQRLIHQADTNAIFDLIAALSRRLLAALAPPAQLHHVFADLCGCWS